MRLLLNVVYIALVSTDSLLYPTSIFALATHALPWTEFEDFVQDLDATAHQEGKESLYRLQMAVIAAGYCGLKVPAILRSRWFNFYQHLELDKHHALAARYMVSHYSGMNPDIWETNKGLGIHHSPLVTSLINRACRLAITLYQPNSRENIFRQNYLDDYILLNLKAGTRLPMKSQYLDRWLKAEFRRFKPGSEPISMTTLHKTYVRHWFELMGKSSDSLIKISSALNHSSAQYTSNYMNNR
jgi:hypothetical protein